MMSKPAATARDRHQRPQTAIDDFGSNVVRRAASSDLGISSRPYIQPQRSQQNIPTIHNSFLSFSPVDVDSPSTSAAPWRSPISEPSSNRNSLQPEIKRKRSLLKKSRPTSTQVASINKDSSSGGSTPAAASPKVLTPAASLIEEYRESERRRAKLAQTAGEAFSKPTKSFPKAPDVQPHRSLSVPQTMLRKTIPSFHEEAPFSDYFVPSTTSQSNSTVDKSADNSFSQSTPPRKSVDRPSLRINVNSNDRYVRPPVTSATDRPTGPSMDFNARKKSLIIGESLNQDIQAKRKPSSKATDTPTAEGISPSSNRIWKLVKRLSSTVLRDKPENEISKGKEFIPPVPAIPAKIRHTIQPEQIPSKRIDSGPLSGEIPPSYQGIKKRSSTTVDSSGLSTEQTVSGFSLLRPSSNRSSTSSYGAELLAKPVAKDPVLRSRIQQLGTSTDNDNSDSPLIPTFTTRGNVVNRFERFDKAVSRNTRRSSRRPATAGGIRSETSSQLSFSKVSLQPTPSPRPTGYFSTRKSTDGTRRLEPRGRVEIVDIERTERRRTRSLDRLLSGAPVEFRALGDSHPPLTEEQKDKRWAELLRRSDLAGGTISVSASPIIT